MSSPSLVEVFSDTGLHPSFSWLNPPADWSLDLKRRCLLLRANPQTDFWQRTHYGFRVDNGHFLYVPSNGDIVLTARFLSLPVQQYDQAGLMIRFSENCWLKTSVEFEDGGPSQLGAVVTNHGFSDWSLQSFPYGDELVYWLRIRNEGLDFLVEHAPAEKGPWQLLRLAHLHAEPSAIQLSGCYACSPKGDGYRAEISEMRLAGCVLPVK